MSPGPRFPFDGDPAIAPAMERALRRVVDPEMAIDIVELGLVYGVATRERAINVRITMTSAACPVTEQIVGEVGEELRRAFGGDVQARVDVVWDPPWEPEMMGERARAALAWD